MRPCVHRDAMAVIGCAVCRRGPCRSAGCALTAVCLPATYIDVCHAPATQWWRVGRARAVLPPSSALHCCLHCHSGSSHSGSIQPALELLDHLHLPHAGRLARRGGVGGCDGAGGRARAAAVDVPGRARSGRRRARRVLLLAQSHCPVRRRTRASPPSLPAQCLPACCLPARCLLPRSLSARAATPPPALAPP